LQALLTMARELMQIDEPLAALAPPCWPAWAATNSSRSRWRTNDPAPCWPGWWTTCAHST